MKLSIFGKSKEESSKQNKDYKTVTYSEIEHAYDKGEFVDSALMLITLLEYYGEQKKKGHKHKGRDFIHFILSAKHKDLKNEGYKHWINIEKIVRANKTTVYPYHQENLKKAIFDPHRK